ncbi:MAG: SulP family inorganic anion transporter [Chloroflexota bacterium]|nr:SulP family inorganic anion transporter [Chloroflexota bacterium]MDE2919914.1 SulP family inorganic anion transporter [Chloroflexota bacterium]
MRLKISYDLPTLRGDLFGGVTAAVVGLPVALAFGVASGLGPVAGLYGAIAVGFFAAVFGGTRSQISGPTGPMAVAMAVIVTTHAQSLTEAFTIAVMAGLIQIALGVLRIGRFVGYTPYSVISGFMSGVGIIIILVQTLPFLGAPVATGGPLGAVQAWPEAIRDVNFGALVIAGVTLAVGVAWPSRLRKFLPPTLAALIAGTLLGVLWLTDTPVIGEVPTGLPTLRFPELAPDVLVRAVQPAIIIALLGSIDSLLTSLVADSMTRTRHNPNRELVGQGIGNVAAGLIGGLPGAGATLGTVVNLRAGGRTPVSGALRAAILLALVLGLGRYVEAIPHAALAGILMKVGWDIIDWRFLTRIHRVQREHLLVMLITLGLTVFLDLITAVAIGLIAAGMASARQFERLQMDSVVSVPLLDRSFFGAQDDEETADAFSARVGLVALRGSFTVASANKLISTISVDVRDHEVVILDFSDTVYMDDSAALVVEQLIDSAMAESTEVIVMGLEGRPAITLQALNALQHVPSDRFVKTEDEARVVAQRLLAG